MRVKMKGGTLIATSIFQCVLTVTLVQLVNPLSFGDSHDQTPLVDTSTEATFLKLVFSDGEEQYFRNWECPDGVWAEDMNLIRQPNCVCVKGIYAIATNLCDEDFKILVGDDHCFDVRGQTIRKFIPLTGKFGFNGKANTVFRKDGAYFARLMSTTPTTSATEPMHYILRMNDDNDLAVYAKLSNGKAAKLKCFPGQDVDMKGFPPAIPAINIAKLPNCSNEFRGPKAWCSEGDFTQEYEWTLSLGTSWAQKDGKIGSGEKYPGSCASSKGPSKSVGRKPGRKKRSPKSLRKPVSTPAVVVEEEPKCDKFDEAKLEDEEFDTTADHLYFSLPDLPEKFHPASEHQKLVNEQNKRIGHQLRRFYLDPRGKIDIPRFKGFDEFQYVRLSKQILMEVCKHEDVPQFVLDFLIRAFRLLYIDSSTNYPYPIKPNTHEHQRAIGALTQCQTGAKPIYFMGNNTCPDLGIYATNQSDILYEYGTNLTLPGEQAYNVSSMDVAVELVWKLVLLSHYYCAKDFGRSFDHSILFVKMEAMLKNPVILFRWYYPGDFNRMMQFFLMNYDLVKFAQAVDRCVVTAYAGSNYTEWVTRPTELLGWTASPKKVPHETGGSATGVVVNVSGRKKRFYLQDDIWNKQAYCMHTTNAPYSEVRTSTFTSCKRKPIWFDNTD